MANLAIANGLLELADAALRRHEFDTQTALMRVIAAPNGVDNLIAWNRTVDVETRRFVMRFVQVSGSGETFTLAIRDPQ